MPPSIVDQMAVEGEPPPVGEPPAGWAGKIEQTMQAFHDRMHAHIISHQEDVRPEDRWEIYKIHWEQNRFMHDQLYVEKTVSPELVSPLPAFPPPPCPEAQPRRASARQPALVCHRNDGWTITR